MAQDPLTQMLLNNAGGDARLVDRLRELERRLLALIAGPGTCGYVNSAGVRQWGEGFGSARTAVGRYTLTFTRPFSPYPMVVAMADAALVASMPVGYTPLPTEFKILTFNSAAVAAADAGFFFVARQP